MLLEQFLQDAWRDHAHDVKGVATRLRGARELMTESAHVTPLTRLIVHVFGEHLGDWEGAQRELQRLSQHALSQHDDPAQSALRVANAALTCAQGKPIPPTGLTTEERISALCSGSAVALGRNELHQATDLFDAALALVQLGITGANSFHRPLAVAANNLASSLGEMVGRSPAQNALMLHAAQVSRVYWEKAGGWLEIERAEYMLAKSNLRAGQTSQARPHAIACLSICQANQAPDFELFFAHEMLATVARALNQREEFDRELAQAAAVFARLPADDQAACKGDLDALMVPG
ncbi:hypothetical protein [Rhodoferax sp.]|uniref:hypothetical protein n=1 Tax=Rhodoferax sp. TaxID=50421 RepID=UPI002779AB22|nr:hypothetical protein [Rhodoferax sp.]